MFKDLRNEANISFNLKLDSPLSIRSGSENGIDPTLPDMQCIRTYKDGKNTVFIPGSSIKGVIRSRSEKIMNFLGGKTCNIVVRKDSCSIKDKKDTGEETYKDMCPSCKMFGSGLIGSRVRFKDAYPIAEPKIGFRNGVGINRITGAAQNAALYDYEVVEEGVFAVTITLTNYELYQLKLLMFVINDINEGYVEFGGAASRGNGKMNVENLKIRFRDYRKGPNKLTGFYKEDVGENLEYKKALYYYEAKKEGAEEIMRLLENIDVEEALREAN